MSRRGRRRGPYGGYYTFYNDPWYYDPWYYDDVVALETALWWTTMDACWDPYWW